MSLFRAPPLFSIRNYSLDAKPVVRGHKQLESPFSLLDSVILLGSQSSLPRKKDSKDFRALFNFVQLPMQFYNRSSCVRR